MQNMSIITAQPATPTQTSTPIDNSSASQAAEPFGNVLARQRSNTDASQASNNVDSQNQESSAANDASATGTVNQTVPTAPTPDVSATLPGDMLAALLPTNTGTGIPPAKDKTNPQAPVPNGANTLPSDMLAMMLPTASGTSTTTTKDTSDLPALIPNAVNTSPNNVPTTLLATDATTGNGLQESTMSRGKKAQSQPNPTAVPDASQIPAGLMVATGTPVTGTPIIGTSLSGTSVSGTSITETSAKRTSVTGTSNTGILATGAPVTGTLVAGTLATGAPATGISTTGTLLAGTPVAGASIAGANTNTDRTFAATLATLSNNGTLTAQPDSGAAKILMQQVAPPAVDSLLQSGIVPIAAGQNGGIQATQTVINTPVSDQAWSNEFSQKITWMSTQHEQTAELHLNPPNLGPLNVVLKVSGDQATALFTSPHAAVRDAVEQALPQLRNMMADNGITLGNATVSDQSPKDQQAWQANQQQKGNGGGTAATTAATVAAGNIPSVATASLGSLHQGMVDIFA